MCTPETLKQVLDETTAGLREIFGNQLADVILYGSYARGDADDESDVNILALIQGVAREKLWERHWAVGRVAAEADLRHGVFVNILLEDVPTFEKYADTNALFRNIVREGISCVRVQSR